MGNEKPTNEVTCPPQVIHHELNANGVAALREAGGCIVAATVIGKLENGVVVADSDRRHGCTRATGCLMLTALAKWERQPGNKAA